MADISVRFMVAARSFCVLPDEDELIKQFLICSNHDKKFAINMLTYESLRDIIFNLNEISKMSPEYLQILIKAMITTSMSKQNNENNKIISSEGDSMENIESLTSKVQHLDSSFMNWYNWSNILVVVFIFVGAFLYYAQFKANKTAILLSKAKDDVSDYKDREQKIQIKKVENDAAEKISQVKIEADKQIALLNAEAAKANAEIAKAHEKTEELKKQNLELEQAVSPRIMEQYKSSEALKVLTGVTAIITTIPDLESQKMAGQLATTLNMAGWNIQFSPYNPKDIYSDGVIIEKNVGALPKEDIAAKAAELLLDQLKINKIESRTMPATDLPPNTIVVKVGFKPYTFFTNKMNQGENIRVHGNMIMPPR